MRLTPKRFTAICEEGARGGLVTLDDPGILARERACPKTALLLGDERARLGRMHRFEDAARAEGHAQVAGVDEVGRGPLAGPLVAAAVIFDGQPWIPMLDDSKKIDEALREALYEVVRARALAAAVTVVEVDELNVSNLHKASLEAMHRALRGLRVPPDMVLVDGCHAVPGLACEQRAIVKGDALSVSIAAASVIAKVTRDRIMRALDVRWPGYGFAHNKGYGTTEHLEALARLGPTPVHRTRFAPVARVADTQLALWADET